MNLIVMHGNSGPPSGTNGGQLLKFAACAAPLAEVLFSCLNARNKPDNKKRTAKPSAFGKKLRNACTASAHHRRLTDSNIIAIPQDWIAKAAAKKTNTTASLSPGTERRSNQIYFKENLPLNPAILRRLKADEWLIISNARFAVRIDHRRLYNVLHRLKADLTAVNVLPQLQAANEKVLTGARGRLLGFRRCYADLVQPAPTPNDWPHLLFIKTRILNRLLVDDTLPLAFCEVLNRCSSNSLTVHSLNIGGTVLDLETEQGLLRLLAETLNSSAQALPGTNSSIQKKSHGADGGKIADSARLFGKVLLGQNVTIGEDAIIVGPTLICNNVKIAPGAVIKTSVIGPDLAVARKQFIRNRIIKGPRCNFKRLPRDINNNSSYISRSMFNSARKHHTSETFRTWPSFSYARCLKRIADVVAAVIILILFAPVLPIIALAVKLLSRGPVFFKDTREGLHGRTFRCLKFRTMLVGSDKIQEKLRTINEVDGPQFRMKNDPRTSTVGKFLRETYIDEIPQFFNVLRGQMSLVGPRPSPQSENTLCPPWRDARLSVRPGITGLWQICRTRQSNRDFQEWIHYDIKYVRTLSLKLDLWICGKTISKLIRNFINQF